MGSTILAFCSLFVRCRASAAETATLRLFGPAREAAGTGRDEIAAGTVAEVITEARARYGAAFAALLPTCKVWVNGEPSDGERALDINDEVAILPPVSGG